MKDYQFIYRIADKFHNNQLLRFFFLKIYRRYKRRVARYKKRAFNKNGIIVLANFNKALNEAGCEYWLEFGTLIGAIRENGFIQHDDDIDVGMFLKDRPFKLEEHMAKYGFKRSRHIIVDDGQDGFEETYEMKGVSIDIFYFHQTGNEIYCYDFLTDPDTSPREFMDKVGGFWARKVIFPFTGLTNHNFLGIQLKIPTNYDEHLKAHYGNYMQPDPNWGVKKANGTILMKDKIGKQFIG